MADRDKKGQSQISGLIVFIVLTVLSLAVVGMFESESHFISNTINSYTSASSSSVANVLVKLIIPIMVILGLLGAFLIIRGYMFG